MTHRNDMMSTDTYWLGGVFMVLSNVFFGTCFVLYNAWLPLLAADHSKVRDMPEGKEKTSMFNNVMDDISSKGQ